MGLWSVEPQLGSVGGPGVVEAGRPGGALAAGEGAGGRARLGPGVQENICGWAGRHAALCSPPVPLHLVGGVGRCPLLV